jgi:molybdopterin-guanine dinucleotide biosynthesis protein A
MKTPAFTAVVLAGGASRRMGRDKAWLLWEGEPLIRRQIALARKAGAAEVFVSGRPGVDYGRDADLVLLDRSPGLGPLSGIERALEAASHDLILAMAVDQPRLTEDFLRWLLSSCGGRHGAIARLESRLEPLPGVYPKSLLPRVSELLRSGRLALRDLIAKGEELGALTVVEAPREHAGVFENWNRPEDVSIYPDRTG